MTKRLKKNSTININDTDYKESLELCKQILTNEPLLQYIDFTKEFFLTTDTSNAAIGAVLSQKIDNKDLPIAYASRTLNDTETNLATIGKELLAIVWSTNTSGPTYTDENLLSIAAINPYNGYFP